MEKLKVVKDLNPNPDVTITLTAEEFGLLHSCIQQQFKKPSRSQEIEQAIKQLKNVIQTIENLYLPTFVWGREVKEILEKNQDIIQTYCVELPDLIRDVRVEERWLEDEERLETEPELTPQIQAYLDDAKERLNLFLAGLAEKEGN